MMQYCQTIYTHTEDMQIHIWKYMFWPAIVAMLLAGQTDAYFTQSFNMSAIMSLQLISW